MLFSQRPTLVVVVSKRPASSAWVQSFSCRKCLMVSPIVLFLFFKTSRANVGLLVLSSLERWTPLTLHFIALRPEALWLPATKRKNHHAHFFLSKKKDIKEV